MKHESSLRERRSRRVLIRNRAVAGLLLICLLLMSAGCSGQWSASKHKNAYESSQKQQEESSCEEDAKNPSTKEASGGSEGNLTHRNEAVWELSCIRPASYCNIVPVQDKRALVAWNDYEAGTISLRIVDTENDKVIMERDLFGSYDLVVQVFSDGGFALRDWDRSRYLFLDRNLNETGEFPCSEAGGFLNSDHSYFYFIKDRILCRTSTETGETLPAAIQTDLRFAYTAGIDLSGRFLQLSVYLTPFGTECGTAVIDLESESLIMLSREMMNTSLVEKDRAIFEKYDASIEKVRVSYGNKDSFYSIGSEVFPKNQILSAVADSDLMVGVSQDSRLYRLGRDGSVEVSNLADLKLYGGLEPKCFLKEPEYLIGSLYTNRQFRLMIFSIKDLNFAPLEKATKIDSTVTIDSSVIEAYANSLGAGAVPENMVLVRQSADLLEETYGVRILLSDQCSDMLGYSGYQIDTTDQAELYDEAISVQNFLGSLEQALSLYPEGYFRQFRNSFDEGGICFLPVGEIVSDIGAIGLCFEITDFQCIAVDVRQQDVIGTICHEIWHASENKMWQSFDKDAWLELNPEGFVYDDDRAFYEEIGDPLPVPEDPRMTDPSGFTYFSSTGSDVYFADDYARTLAREDRARIMEYFMDPNLEFFAENMILYEPIYQKLLLLSRSLREGFDTEGWENVRWERFFTPEEIEGSDAALIDRHPATVLEFSRTVFFV